MPVMTSRPRVAPGPSAVAALAIAALLTPGCGPPEVESAVLADLGDLGSVVPLLDLGELTPAQCRAPSTMATTTEEANRLFPCRKMKLVQHHLATLLYEKSFLTEPAELGDIEPDLQDADKRRQYFFGRYWSSYDPADPEREAHFHEDLARTFPLLTAVLIASINPTDIDDGVDDWWWELPWIYSQEPDLEARRAMMRDDVNGWIQASGYRMTANVGTPDTSLAVNAEGDFDMVLIDQIAFVYLFRDHPELLDDQSVWTLFNKAMPGSLPVMVDLPEWVLTNLPVSGLDFDEALTASHLGIHVSETENHVLMTLVHFYLANQWISRGYRLGGHVPTPPNPAIPVESWWSTTDPALVQAVRDAAARVVHSGMFENNALPYQGYSYLALQTLASYAEDATVRTEAENALHFLAATFTFQSFEGRRWAPMRRNCKYAANLEMYTSDGLVTSMGMLSGAYKWNDSPYGYKRFRAGEPCRKAPGCYWRTYSFKRDHNGDDGVADRIPADDEELADDLANEGLTRALFTAFGSYRLPPALHDFTIDKHTGYYARMMPKYDRQHYRTSIVPQHATPLYFSGNKASDDVAINNERTPAFYFATNSFLNSSGGAYNPYMAFPEQSFIIPDLPGLPCEGHPSVSIYDHLSRPNVVLPQVPRIVDALTGEPHYEPFGVGGEYDVSEAGSDVPMMRGNVEQWFKSVNLTTYKNFSYGYRARRLAPLLFEWLGGQSPVEVPPDWASTRVSFSVGAANFTIYDVRDVMASQGRDGFFLVTAAVRKLPFMPWSLEVARGFWEVVPGTMFADLGEVKAAVLALNPPDHFELGWVGAAEDYDYTMVTTNETLRLDQKFGLHRRNMFVLDDGTVQGLIGVQDAAGAGHDLETIFTDVKKSQHTNHLPLIDVKPVGPDFNFTYTNGKHDYYACARSGWLCVNNAADGTYLWVDSRRGPGFPDNPRWEHGRLDEAPAAWGCSCEVHHGGAVGAWIPGPPELTTPEACSDPGGCEPGGDPGDPGDCEGDCPTDPCDPVIPCDTHSQCPSEVCDLVDHQCLCVSPAAESCDVSSTTSCDPDLPDCGPGEICVVGTGATGTCQCPPCIDSSREPCSATERCVDPAEQCVGISEPGGTGECACLW